MNLYAHKMDTRLYPNEHPTFNVGERSYPSELSTTHMCTLLTPSQVGLSLGRPYLSQFKCVLFYL